MSTVIDGSASVTINSGAVLGITSGTAQNSTSGTSIPFTSIPSWVKRITVMLNGVSTAGSTVPLVQIGSGSYSNSGYVSYGTNQTTSTIAPVTSTTGFLIPSGNSANVIYATYTLVNITGNIWMGILSGGMVSGASYYSIAGGGTSPTLSGALDRLQVLTPDGFDLGSINILYE